MDITEFLVGFQWARFTNLIQSANQLGFSNGNAKVQILANHI